MNIIISPHLDDGILSLGQFITTASAAVVTIFAGLPDPSVLTDYDRDHGFTTSRDAMQARRSEDEAACAEVGAEVVHLDFLDHQYGQPSDDEQIVAAVRRFMHSDWLLFVPLGIGHPDHIQVARCARAACDTGTLVAYEEAPYRVLYPEQVVDALEKVRAEGFAVGEMPYPLERGPRERKLMAVQWYCSQFPDDEALSDPCLYVPERAHRIAR